MFGIGGTELLVILVVALVVLGPKSVPQLARTLGKAMGEFRRVSTEFQRTLNMEAADEELAERKRKTEAETKAADMRAAETAMAEARAAESVTTGTTPPGSRPAENVDIQASAESKKDRA